MSPQPPDWCRGELSAEERVDASGGVDEGREVARRNMFGLDTEAVADQSVHEGDEEEAVVRASRGTDPSSHSRSAGGSPPSNTSWITAGGSSWRKLGDMRERRRDASQPPGLDRSPSTVRTWRRPG